MNLGKSHFACLLLTLVLLYSPSAVAHGDTGEYCFVIDGHLAINEDAGATPEDARDLTQWCDGHLLRDVDETDLLKDPVLRPGGTPIDYRVVNAGDDNAVYESTLRFRLLWIGTDSVEVLDESTLDINEIDHLKATTPDGLDVGGHAYIEITLVSAENDEIFGYTVHRGEPWVE